MERYKIYRNEIVAGTVNPHYINARQGLEHVAATRKQMYKLFRKLSALSEGQGALLRAFACAIDLHEAFPMTGQLAKTDPETLALVAMRIGCKQELIDSTQACKLLFAAACRPTTSLGSRLQPKTSVVQGPHY